MTDLAFIIIQWSFLKIVNREIYSMSGVTSGVLSKRLIVVWYREEEKRLQIVENRNGRADEFWYLRSALLLLRIRAGPVGQASSTPIDLEFTFA